MFIAPTTLPDDPATLQLILRAALAEIERLQLELAGLLRDNLDERRIASPETLPGADPLPHLTCSPPMHTGGEQVKSFSDQFDPYP